MPKIFKLLLVSAFFNALSWIVLIPTWQYPDEQAHFAQVQGTAEPGKIIFGENDTSYEIALSEKILQTERDQFGNNKFTYHPNYRIKYSGTTSGLFEKTISDLPISSRSKLVKREATFNPPLYYLLASFAYKLGYSGDLFTRVYAIRIMSTFFFIFMIFITFKISQIIFENQKHMQFTLPSIVAFTPMLVFSSTGILPDPLVNMLFTLMVLVGLMVLKHGIKIKYLIFIAGLLFLGTYTRQNFVLSSVIPAAALFVRAFQFKRARIELILFSISLIGLVVFSTLFGTKIPFISNFRIQEFAPLKLSQVFNSELLDYLKQTLGNYYRQTFVWYFGVYKWLSLSLPLIYYRLIKLLVILSALGLSLHLATSILKRKITNEAIYSIFFILYAAAYTFVILVWDYFFYKKSGYSFGIQGRYFFTLVVIHLALLLLGLKQFFDLTLKKYAKYTIFAVLIATILFNDLSLFHVSSSYYETSSLSTFITQTSQYKPQLFKGNAILLILVLNMAFQAFLLFSTSKYILKEQSKSKFSSFSI